MEERNVRALRSRRATPSCIPSTRDPLTGWLHRRAFFERGEALMGWESDREPGTLLLHHGRTSITSSIQRPLWPHGGDLVIQRLRDALARPSHRRWCCAAMAGEEFCRCCRHAGRAATLSPSAARRHHGGLRLCHASSRRSIRSHPSFGLAATSQGFTSLKPHRCG